MATIDVKDAANATVTLEKPLAPGRAAAAASRPAVLSTEDKAALDALATQVTAAAILAKIIAAPATEAKQDTGNTSLASIASLLTTQAGYLDGIEALLGAIGTQTTLAAILAKIIAAPATEAKQDTGNTALARLAPVTLGASTDLAFNNTSAQSGALTGTLIRVVAKSADCRILTASNPTALSASTLLIAGVEYYFAITTGHKVAAIRDASTDGTLNITVVG